MQLNFLASLVLIVAAAAQVTVTRIYDTEAAWVTSELASYQSSVATQSQFLSANSVLATALPASLAQDPNALYTELSTATALPEWYIALPSDVKSYVASLGEVEASIVNLGHLDPWAQRH